MFTRGNQFAGACSGESEAGTDPPGAPREGETTLATFPCRVSPRTGLNLRTRARAHTGRNDSLDFRGVSGHKRCGCVWSRGEGIAKGKGVYIAVVLREVDFVFGRR